MPPWDTFSNLSNARPQSLYSRYSQNFIPPAAVAGSSKLEDSARVAKLADALDLGSSAARRAGSTPASRIRIRSADQSAAGAAALALRFRQAELLVELFATGKSSRPCGMTAAGAASSGSIFGFLAGASDAAGSCCFGPSTPSGSGSRAGGASGCSDSSAASGTSAFGGRAGVAASSFTPW